MREPPPQEEFDRIFSRVPRLTVELVIASDDRGVLLAMRDFGPCQGLWHLPGGTVRFGEPLVEAVKRVAQDELGVAVSAGETLGYIGVPKPLRQRPRLARRPDIPRRRGRRPARRARPPI